VAWYPVNPHEELKDASDWKYLPINQSFMEFEQQEELKSEACNVHAYERARIC
jgi:hypothetical protein